MTKCLRIFPTFWHLLSSILCEHGCQHCEGNIPSIFVCATPTRSWPCSQGSYFFVQVCLRQYFLFLSASCHVPCYLVSLLYLPICIHTVYLDLHASLYHSVHQLFPISSPISINTICSFLGSRKMTTPMWCHFLLQRSHIAIITFVSRHFCLTSLSLLVGSNESSTKLDITDICMYMIFSVAGG